MALRLGLGLELEGHPELRVPQEVPHAVVRVAQALRQAEPVVEASMPTALL